MKKVNKEKIRFYLLGRFQTMHYNFLREGRNQTRLFLMDIKDNDDFLEALTLIEKKIKVEDLIIFMEYYTGVCFSNWIGIDSREEITIDLTKNFHDAYGRFYKKENLSLKN